MTDQIVEATSQVETQVDTSNPQVEVKQEVKQEQSIIGSEPVVNTESKVEPDWREDWLDKMAGDEKAKNILGRYASPKAVGEALVAAQKKISSYKPQVELPQNPTEEDIKNYRKAYSIPEDPKGYDIKLDNGLIIGEEDQVIVDKFLERAHARHAKPSEVKAVLQDYFETQHAQTQEITKRLDSQRQEAEDELRAEWGGNYRQNANIINNFVANKFGEQSENILNAVLADGTLLKNNPKVIRQFLSLAQEVDPVATIGRAGMDANSIDQEIAEIEKVMKQDNRAYFNDKSMVKKYEDLITARDRMKSRQ